jgi:hypothetical protein
VRANPIVVKQKWWSKASYLDASRRKVQCEGCESDGRGGRAIQEVAFKVAWRSALRAVSKGPIRLRASSSTGCKRFLLQ